MALDFDGRREDTPRVACPLQCRLRRAAQDDQLDERVDWAGLPINLDFAFSPQQRDKVYRQHLMRKRRTQLRWGMHAGHHVCVCEEAANDGRRVAQDDADSMPRR